MQRLHSLLRCLMKYVVLFLALMFIHNSVSSQELYHYPPEFKNMFRNATIDFQKKEYRKAINIYQKLLTLDSLNNNIKFLLGYSYLMADYEPEYAIRYLKPSIVAVSNRYKEGAYHERSVPTLAYFLLGKAYQRDFQFDLAVVAYEKYESYLDFLSLAEIEYVKRHILSCELAKSMINNPVSVDFISMSAFTDKDNPCSNPVVSGNDSTMIFTIQNQDHSVIAQIFRTEDGWTAPTMLDIGWNMPGDFYPVSISRDGRELYLVYKDEMVSDLYVSRYRAGYWSEPESLGDFINTPYDETHASISSDGKLLYIASNKKGGWGGSDLYVSERDDKGRWLRPKNLGFGINTYYNEDTPFITDNDSVLYYSSDGFETMGGYDIYATRLDQGAFFMEPKHLRYPISTPDDDLFYNPGWDGLTSYFARKPAGEKSGSVIYTIVNGTRDAIVDTKPETQRVVDEHYYFVNAILFDFNNYHLNEHARKEVDFIYAMMQKNPNIEIELIGHTDDKGSEDYNISLSKKRAESVRNYLVDKGIANGRIKILALGEYDPVAINRYADGTDAPDGRSLNRNVSIRINNQLEDNIRMAEIFVPPALVPAQDRVFTILLLETENLLDTMPDAISGQPVSLIYTDESKMYVMGSFNQITDAQDYLDMVIDNGYPDAYIMEKRNFETAIRKRTHGDQMEDLEYTIQVLALRKRPVRFSYFSELDDIKMYEGSDGYYRYIYGTFKKIDQAQRTLTDVKKIKKYNSAFIRPLSFYEDSDSE